MDPASQFSGLIGGLSQPLPFRVLLEPAIGVMLAVADGVADARRGRPPFLWALLAPYSHRSVRRGDAWLGPTRVALAALLADIACQEMVRGHIDLLSAAAATLLLALVPYVLLRGLVTRFAPKAGRPS